MNIELRQSEIHGTGVFAVETIRRGYWQYVYGQVMPYRPGSPCERYMFEWDDDRGYLPYAPFCFLNHSDDPNCEVDCDDRMLTVETLRTIHPGEELTIDYGFNPNDYLQDLGNRH